MILLSIHISNDEFTMSKKTLMLMGCSLIKAGTASFLIMLLAGCTNKEPCDMEDRTAIRYSELTAPKNGVLALKNIDDSEDRVYLVIDNQKAFEQFVYTSTELPEVDFSKQLILAGKMKWHNCTQFNSQSVWTG